jgi:phage-related protein
VHAIPGGCAVLAATKVEKIEAAEWKRRTLFVRLLYEHTTGAGFVGKDRELPGMRAETYWFGYTATMPKVQPQPQPEPEPIAKAIEFRGSALKDLRDFPKGVREDCGYQLYKVQIGEQPDDFKPMAVVGKGVEEIRVKDEDGIFRVMYTAKFEEAVYVLHAFQKKTGQTSPQDIELAKTRFKQLVNDRTAAKQQKGKP